MKKYTIEAKTHLSNADYFGGNRDTQLNNNVKNIKAIWEGANKYRYAGDVSKTNVFTRYVKQSDTAKRQIVPGESPVVTLGGPFQKVGNQDETVGGDNQKVG